MLTRFLRTPFWGCSKSVVCRTITQRSRNVTIVDRKEIALQVLDKLYALKDEYHAIDTEITDIDIEKSPIGNGKVMCASIYCGPQYNFGGGSRIWIDNLDEARGTLHYFKEYLEDPSIKKVFHNYSFDCHEFQNEGIEVGGFACDTMHMARLWESSRIGKGSYSLESLSEELYIRKRPYKEIFGKPHIKRDGTEGKIVDVPEVIDLQRNPETRNEWIEYSAFDAEATWHVRKELESLLKEMYWTEEEVNGTTIDRTMWDFYQRYYRDFGQLLVNMENRGIRVGGPDLARMNVNSTAQIQQLLFAPTPRRKGHEGLPRSKEFEVENIEGIIEPGKKKPLKNRKITITGLGIPPVSYTAKGLPQCNAATIKTLAGSIDSEDESKSRWGTAYEALGGGERGRDACIALSALNQMNSIEIMLNTFIIPLQSVTDSAHRVHCSLNLNTETGRLSARQPNLQNQPSLEKDIYFVRKAFIADPGNTLLVSDYGQLELRVLAHMTRCKNMLEAFKLGGDFHSRTAMSMYDYIKEDVEKGTCLLEWNSEQGDPPAPLLKHKYASERRKAKILNFSLAYGKTAHGLSKDFGVSLSEAEDVLAKWYKDRPEVQEWQRQTILTAKQTGYTRTLMGRYRPLPDINSRNKWKEGHMCRAAINTPIQGGAADIVMMAMLKVENDERLKRLGYKMLLQIHDEVILEGPKENAEEAKACLIDDMNHPFAHPLLVDLVVDCNAADSWYEAK
ncbi:mitochondrial DNA polymerase [Blastocystis sp. subtype 4]|uniref:mitochondrial DNA polymerase n=1 Tax=Blastocystis sp. subtype 4 TaxID=944170 RepID=UPI0007116424|nr:mitochondrial DNA polymerase [Blastocystis sp. subtype 4]KNB44986.1 mitochondrial DNA polymerase [Blastocystis sp. subtype 4]|eukprot:XP_014528429.1 mitochondrial DNA polymerase [Blastocystis sp. subtype 4]